MLEYHVAFYEVEDGWYMARILDFPGVITQGKNLKEARFMVRDALHEMASWYLEEGKALPLPDSAIFDSDAVLIEPVRLGIHVKSGAAS